MIILSNSHVNRTPPPPQNKKQNKHTKQINNRYIKKCSRPLNRCQNKKKIYPDLDQNYSVAPFYCFLTFFLQISRDKKLYANS